jgi:hypothetical protein
LDTLLDDLEAWMNDNNMVRFNPNKGETILKRDQQGKIARDPITKKLDDMQPKKASQSYDQWLSWCNRW